jgi:hypothetical protein
MLTMFAAVRYQGKMWKVRKQPFESEEQAKDRAWYVALHLASVPTEVERENLSRQWANKKYYQMTYRE